MKTYINFAKATKILIRTERLVAVVRKDHIKMLHDMLCFLKGERTFCKKHSVLLKFSAKLQKSTETLVQLEQHTETIRKDYLHTLAEIERIIDGNLSIR